MMVKIANLECFIHPVQRHESDAVSVEAEAGRGAPQSQQQQRKHTCCCHRVLDSVGADACSFLPLISGMWEASTCEVRPTGLTRSALCCCLQDCIFGDLWIHNRCIFGSLFFSLRNLTPSALKYKLIWFIFIWFVTIAPTESRIKLTWDKKWM